MAYGYGATATNGYGNGAVRGKASRPVGARTSTANTGWRKRRAGRGRTNAPAAIVKNKLAAPKVKFVDMGAAAGQRMAVAGAAMGEKWAHLRANMRLGFYRIAHPFHPVRRVAAKESTVSIKAAATERRRQKVARAVDNASRKRALVRERRAQNLNAAT